MKKIILFTFLAVVLTGCKKEYKYEVWAETGMFSNLADTKISENVITAKNDSIAFVEAVREFHISMDLKFRRNKDFHPEIYYFKLITQDSKNISSGSFLKNPDKVIELYGHTNLSEEFKEYIRNLPKEE